MSSLRDSFPSDTHRQTWLLNVSLEDFQAEVRDCTEFATVETLRKWESESFDLRDQYLRDDPNDNRRVDNLGAKGFFAMCMANYYYDPASTEQEKEGAIDSWNTFERSYVDRYGPARVAAPAGTHKRRREEDTLEPDTRGSKQSRSARHAGSGSGTVTGGR